MTNEQLAIRIKAGEDVAENMERLYLQTRRFIQLAAWRYRGSSEAEDLEQEGYLALHDAVDGFDPDAGCKFLTYAEYKIRHRMQRYMQTKGSCLRLPVHCQEAVRRYGRFCSSFQMEHGWEPSDKEAAAHLGLSLESVRKVREDASLARLGSLDAPVHGLDGEEGTVGDLVPDPAEESLEQGCLDRMQREQLCAVLWECVDGLDGRQPEVIRKKYAEQVTLAAIGAEYGASMEDVRKMEGKALRELRKPRNSKRLRPFMDIYSMALTGGGARRFAQTWTSSTERTALWDMEREGKRRASAG